MFFYFDFYRAIHLRNIRLVDCDSLSDEGFIEAIKKLPQLEELDISYNFYLSKDSFETVGYCCPLLKSLKYGWIIHTREESIRRGEVIFAIANTMPGLRNLKISGDVLSSDGIIAILNGCRLLESLDLRGSCGLFLNKDLWNRCHEEIKDFRLPLQLESYYSG